MDDAASRVKTSSLNALVRLRATRERQALLDLQTSLREQVTAEAARDEAGQDLVRQEAARQERETRLYAALAEQGPLSTDSLEGHRLTAERWTKAVEQASAHLDSAQDALAQAENAVQGARAHYAARARAARKWKEIASKIQGARQRQAEAAGEIDAEDEILSRRGAGPRGSAA